MYSNKRRATLLCLIKVAVIPKTLTMGRKVSLMGRMIFIGPEEILKNKILEKEANTTRSHEDIVTESIIEMENTINSLHSKAKNEAEREFANKWLEEILKLKR